jgi:hypothetical protein
MAVTAFATGTQTAVIGTEHFVSNVNQAGTFLFVVDTANLVALDVVELRAYYIVLTAGTARELYFQRYDGVQTGDIKMSEPVSTELTDAQAIRFSIKQVAGTGRAFPWKVLSFA